MEPSYSFRSRPQFQSLCWCSVLLLRPEQAKSGYTFWTGKGLKAMAKTLRIFLVSKTFPARFHTNLREKSVRGGKLRFHLTVVGAWEDSLLMEVPLRRYLACSIHYAKA